MRRSTFLSVLPAAAAAPLAAAAAPPRESSPPLPLYRPAGAERFIRPDVKSGDRPVGRDLAADGAWPQWKPGSEFRAIREQSAGARR